jgi:hypothetical protein
MSIDDTLDAMERKNSASQMTPQQAIDFLKSVPQCVSLVNFVVHTHKDELLKISNAIAAIKHGFILDCDSDGDETDTVEAMRMWPDIMQFIERWAEIF